MLKNHEGWYDESMSSSSFSCSETIKKYQYVVYILCIALRRCTDRKYCSILIRKENSVSSGDI